MQRPPSWRRRRDRRRVMRGGDWVRTDQRLTEARKNARVAQIDDSSRYVIISDCHRGDGSHSDEFIKNQNAYLHALDYYYEDGFVYVEAGDGDELWEHPNFRHIRNAHPEAFDAVQRFHDDERLILLYGNHDIQLRDPAFVERNFFTYYDDYTELTYPMLRGIEPREALVLEHTGTGQRILVVHGHQGDFYNDQFWFITMLSMKYTWRFMHAFGFQNPTSPSKNVTKRHKIERNYNKWIEKHRMMLICGHTHRFKFPRRTELPYFNTGCCIYPTSMTAIEIAEGAIQLVRWHVVPNDDGLLAIERQTIHGPEPLRKFDIR